MVCRRARISFSSPSLRRSCLTSNGVIRPLAASSAQLLPRPAARATQITTCRSRRPPGLSLQLGSSEYGVSSYFWWRCRISSVLARRNAFAIHRLRIDPAEVVEDPPRAAQVARLEQRGLHRDVALRHHDAFGDGAHARADLQAGVPAGGDEALDRRRCIDLGRGAVGGRQQHEHVDVGIGEQLAAAIAADREQRRAVGHAGARATARAASGRPGASARAAAWRRPARVGRAAAKCCEQRGLAAGETARARPTAAARGRLRPVERDAACRRRSGAHEGRWRRRAGRQRHHLVAGVGDEDRVLPLRRQRAVLA